MSIQTELTLIQNTAQAIKDAIVEQGQAVAATDSWVDLVPKIDNIPNGEGSYSKHPLKDTLEGTIKNLYDESLFYIRPNCFQYCTQLRQAEFKNITKICQNAFNSCYNFKRLILSGDKFVKLDHENAFYYTSLIEIKVPASLLAQYQADPLWSKYTIVAL